MNDELAADLKLATDQENTAKANYEELMRAKKNQIATLSASIEEKTERIAAAGVKQAEMANDLEDTQESLAEDKKFLQDLDKNCATKKDEWAVREKLRAEEQLALADTIKILNDDDALELFKKTLPTPALIQLAVSSKDVRNRARELLKGGDARLNLISLALTG